MVKKSGGSGVFVTSNVHLQNINIKIAVEKDQTGKKNRKEKNRLMCCKLTSTISGKYLINFCITI